MLYKECVDNCPFIGYAIHAAGCLAGYTIFGATNDGTFPKFDFPDQIGFPSSPLGRDTVYYTPGQKELLRVGLWLGCPPECTTGVTLVKGRQDVRLVVFYIVSQAELEVSRTFDEANWIRLGRGGFNRKSNTWELPWDTTNYTNTNGYIVRADFYRKNGKKQTGIGLATQQWTVSSH